MHRQALKMEQDRQAQQDTFISRFGSLPMVSTAWTQACDIYLKTKDRNTVLRTTCNLAEGGVKKIAETTMPLVVKCQPQIDQLNAYACQQLARMEESYPVITQSPDVVMKGGKEKCEALLKPMTDRVTSVQNTCTGMVNKGKETVVAAKNFVPNTVSKVKEYGMSQVTRTMETSYGKFVNEKVQDALTLSEEYVEKYLPASESDGEEEKDEEKEEDKEEEEEEEAAKSGTVARVTSLSSKLRHRMYKRAMKDLRNLQLRSQESLGKLNFTVDLIQYVKNNYGDAKSSLEEKYATAQKVVAEKWGQVMDDEEEEGEDKETPKSFEKKTIAAARRLTKQVRQSVTMVTGYLPETLQPAIVKEKIQNAKEYSEDLFQSFKEAHGFEDIPSTLLTQAQEKMGYLQETFSFLMEKFVLSPVGWLVPVWKRVELRPHTDGSQPEDMEMESMNGE